MMIVCFCTHYLYSSYVLIFIHSSVYVCMYVLTFYRRNGVGSRTLKSKSVGNSYPVSDTRLCTSEETASVAAAAAAVAATAAPDEVLEGTGPEQPSVKAAAVEF